MARSGGPEQTFFKRPVKFQGVPSRIVQSTLITTEGCKYLTILAAERNKNNVGGRRMCGGLLLIEVPWIPLTSTHRSSQDGTYRQIVELSI